MKKLLGVIIFLIVLVGGFFITYNHMISAPSNEDLILEYNVEKGSTYNSIAEDLEKEGYIRSALFYKLYLKLNPVSENLEYGRYYLPTKASVEELLEVFKKGSDTLADTVTVTFVEGKNMRYIISTITKNFNITEKQVLDKLSDTDYLDRLIENYWFLTKDIKNKKLYYSLEGYLYPDTYEYYETASVEDIFKKMLDNMENKLDPYMEDVDKSKYSIHEMLTLASIIEQEAGSANDRSGVAGVFYNRLNDGWSLGSDVTTYYQEKIDNYSRDLTQKELNKCGNYNTRNGCLEGKLPIGPICNPSLESIVAAINPKNHNYYYFVADKNGKTYFNKTYSDHTSTVSKLKRDGLWIEYED